MAGEVKLKDHAVLIKALSDFANAGRNMLKEAENECSKGHPQEKVSETIASMFGLSIAAASFLSRLSVKNRGEAEELWKTAYGNAEVRDATEEVLQLEDEWDSFLQRQDVQQQMSDTLLGEGSRAGSLAGDMAFTDARTGGTVNLAQYLGKGEKLLLVFLRHLAWLPWRDHLTELETNQGLLDARSVRVLVISFDGQEGAQYWLQDTGCKYDMLLDPQRKLYSALGLGTSYAKVFSFDNMFKYAEYMVLNRQFPPMRSAFISDFYQLGGDFVLDEGGRVIYSHPCRGPLDRPAVAEILAGIAGGRHPSNL